MNKTNKPAVLELHGLKIVRAFQPGDLVFIESPQALSREAMQNINAEFKRLVPDVKVVVLQGGLKVAGREEALPPVDLRSLAKQWHDESKGGTDPYEVEKFLDWLEARAAAAP